MSWLYSIIVAGLMFSTQNTLPFHTNYNYTKSNNSQAVRLDETERFEQTYPLNANGKVSVSNVNGSITIETWDNPQVKLEAVKTADSRERLSDLEIKIDSKQTYFQVEADYSNSRNNGKNWNGKLQVEFKLMVPRTAVLDEIETVNGSIYISNAANTTKASAVNGQVKATNLRGTANLSTVNGTVEADFDQLQSDSRISLDSVNGTVNLLIPSDANATIKADTVNGTINNNFGLPVRTGKYVGKDLYGKIGSGEVQIKLNSVNGGLSVKHKNDGRNVNPATNLLPAKNDDDEDLDNDVNVSVNTANINKTVAKAMKTAQKELAEIQPELDKANAEAMKQSAEGLKQAAIVMNSEEVKAQLREAQLRGQEALAQMSNANWLAGSPIIENKSDSFTVKGIPKVTVEAKNSAVSVRGWDKPEVRYVITKISKSRNQTPLDFTAEQKNQDVNIKINDVLSNDEYYSNDVNRIHIEIFVPKKSNLKIVAGGEIRLEGVSGEINLTGDDGAINVRDSDGKLQITSSDGAVRVIGFHGEIDANSSDGTMNLEGDFQTFSARTDDGNIILTLPESANINVESNRKDIKNEGVALKYIGNNNNISTWKVGNGGVNYQLYAEDGQIFLRTGNSIKTN